MTWRWRLGELFGIVIYMHVTFLLLIAWAAFSAYRAGEGFGGAIAGIGLILLVFACVVAHEYGHALTARRYGIETRDITLLPIGGVARLERMPRDPAQELSVALAGPAVSLALAAVLFVLFGLFYGWAGFSGRILQGNLLGQLALFNFIVVLFNLLPAFPMDGGRVLRALLARRMPYVRATRIAADIGQMMAFVFGFLGLTFNIWLLFIALFVYMGAEAEAQTVQVEAAFSGVPVRRAMITRFVTLGAEEPLSRAVQLLLGGAQQDFPVVSDGRVVGLLTRRNLLSALHERGPAAIVAEAMQTDIEPVDVSAPLEETFQRMQTDELPAIPVLEDGYLAGLVTMENIAEFLMVRSALEGAPLEPGVAAESAGAVRERPAWGLRRGEGL